MVQLKKVMVIFGTFGLMDTLISALSANEAHPYRLRLTML